MPRTQVEASYARSREGFAQLASKYRRPTVDIVDASRTIWRGVEETAYLDLCHTNDYGNELIARWLAAHVTP